MRSLKIKEVVFNNRKKILEIRIGKEHYVLPYAKLMLKPMTGNLICKAFVDKELAARAVTYHLQDGSEDSVPVEAFLEYNCDPEYIREIELYKLTVKANDLVESSGLSKRAICRQMTTSLSQLSRLLDETNNQKSIDQMIKLITVLGARVEIKVA